MMVTIRGFFLILLFAAVADTATACACSFEPNPPCKAYGTAELIMDATVLSVDNVNIEMSSGPPVKRRARLKINKIYKGTLATKAEIFTGDGRSDCGYSFKTGKRYLIYASEQDSKLVTYKCGRNSELSQASDDIEFLNSVPSLDPGIRIFGLVEKISTLNGAELRTPFPEVRLEVSGYEDFVIETDSNGKFSKGGLRPGAYSIRLLFPNGFWLSKLSNLNDFYPWPVVEGKSADKGCIEANFVLEPRDK
jgi:hypothetical protein